MGNRGPRSKLEPYDDDIRRMYVSEGMTDEAVAAALPVRTNAETIRMRRKVLGIQTNRVRKTGRYVMKDRYEDVKDELPQAWESSKQFHPVYKRQVGSAERVGEHYGVSGSTAYGWLVRAGVIPPRPSYDRDAPTALELFEGGHSVPRIAEDMCLPQETIRGWLKRKGISLTEQHPSSRMSHEEKLAWRGSISDAKAQTEDTTRRHPYGEHMLGSKYEVIAATQFDRVGLP